MTRPCKALTFVFVLFLVVQASVKAQDLASIGKKKPITITGGLSLNQILYGVSGIESRRTPYTYFASGNINFSLYGWSVPLTFAVSNQNTSFHQPFNQYSINPTYKWITGHFGYTSMSYSSYTVNGHIFLGAGVDVVTDGKWKFSGLYGRFLKAVEPDTVHKNNQLPSFKRLGYGFKASYGSGGNSVDFILFHAKDDVNSIAYVPDSLNVLPQENLVVSIGASKTLLEHFVLKGELASSAITRDTRAEEFNNSHPLSNTGFLYTSRASSSYYKAVKTSLNFQQDVYSIGVAYERIDPQYRTLGAYYFNNDLESITMNGATAILHGKMNVAVSGGSQHDNLDNNKVSTMRRLVGSLNVNYAPSQKLNLSGTYSTFQTYTNIRSQFVNINQLTPYDNLDTLKFTQISKSASVMAMYALGSNENKKQRINVNLMYQGAADTQGGVQQNSGMKFYNVNTAYSLSIVPQNVTMSISFNGTLNEGAGTNTKTLGPTAAVNKSMLDRKLRITLSSSYNNTYNGSQKISTIMNVRLNGNLTVHKKHNLNLSIATINRKTASGSKAKSFTEFTGTLGYSYSFGTR